MGGCAVKRAGPLVVAIVIAAAGLGPAGAVAAVPFRDIASGGPLTHVYVGNELSCQIAHAGDAAFELYPSTAAPGDCGTLVFAGGGLYAPNFPAHDSTATSSSLGPTTAYTSVSQTPVSGAGTASSPFRVVTVVDLGSTGLRITQTDSYVTGDESYRTDVTLANTTGAAVAATIYRAGDCYLQGTDTGFGFTSPAQTAVGCSANPNNSPPARIEQWLPITTGNLLLEATFSDVWGAIAGRSPLDGSCRCADNTDNGAAISWAVNVPPGGQVTRSHYTTFSPRGVTAPPPSAGPPPGAVPPAFGPTGVIQIPASRMCLSRRHFTIHIRKYRGLTYEQAIVFVNRRRVGVLRGRQFSAGVDLRNLPAGTFVVQITVITTKGRIITGTRTYHTCRKRLPFLGAPRL
jgi:hypothetical protein